MQITVISQTAKSKPLPEWLRVSTSDDSFIDLNTNYVIFSSNKLERVRFRWTYQSPQGLVGKRDVKFKTILQEMQFDCRSEKYRVYSSKWLDSDEKIVASDNKKESEELKSAKPGSMIGKLYSSACSLVELRKREPPIEQ